jgi:hypothetical protein
MYQSPVSLRPETSPDTPRSRRPVVERIAGWSSGRAGARWYACTGQPTRRTAEGNGPGRAGGPGAVLTPVPCSLAARLAPPREHLVHAQQSQGPGHRRLWPG